MVSLRKNMPIARGLKGVAVLTLFAALSSCNPFTAVFGSDFSIEAASTPSTVRMCTSHSASFCGSGGIINIPVVVHRTNYEGDITLSLNPAQIDWLSISLPPMIPGPNTPLEHTGWYGDGYVPDHATLGVIAFSMGATVPESVYGTKALVINGTGPDGKVRTTSVTFTVAH
jgi:hypothetical protein